MKQAIVSAFIRAVRTFVQTALGVYLAGLTVSPALGDLASWDPKPGRPWRPLSSSKRNETGR